MSGGACGSIARSVALPEVAVLNGTYDQLRAALDSPASRVFDPVHPTLAAGAGLPESVAAELAGRTTEPVCRLFLAMGSVQQWVAIEVAIGLLQREILFSSNREEVDLVLGRVERIKALAVQLRNSKQELTAGIISQFAGWVCGALTVAEAFALMGTQLYLIISDGWYSPGTVQGGTYASWAPPSEPRIETVQQRRYLVDGVGFIEMDEELRQVFRSSYSLADLDRLRPWLSEAHFRKPLDEWWALLTNRLSIRDGLTVSLGSTAGDSADIPGDASNR